MIVYEHVRAVDSISRKVQGKSALLPSLLLGLLCELPFIRRRWRLYIFPNARYFEL